MGRVQLRRVLGRNDGHGRFWWSSKCADCARAVIPLARDEDFVRIWLDYRNSVSSTIDAALGSRKGRWVVRQAWQYPQLPSVARARFSARIRYLPGEGASQKVLRRI